jgi:mannosyltransferase OCH1-like enzyme/GR25 family glycosyltransferase involved in LPS biosynthesis
MKESFRHELKIPKIIIQTWKTNKISGKIGDLINKLKSNNPDFEYKFYTDDDIVEFIKTKYPEYYSTFISFEYTIQKIDFFRLICVYHYGGFYVDIDMDINKSIEPLCKYDCVFPKESVINNNLLNFKSQNMNIILGNYAFGASPKNSFIKLCIDNIINKRIKLSDIPNNNDRFESYVENTPSHMKKSQSYIDHVLYTTGPILISQSYIDYNFKDKIKIIEPTPFKIYAFGDYGKHLAIGTWKGMENIKTRDKNPNLTDLGYDIYYINLKKSTERNSHMINTYKRITRIDAYNGKTLNLYDNIYIDDKLIKTCKPNELGCSLSHISAILQAYDDNKDEVLIMEDDMYISYKYLWKKDIQTIINNSPKDKQCIQLHLIHPTYVYNNIVNNKDYAESRSDVITVNGTVAPFPGTGCYYINRKGMEIIRKIYLKNNKIVLKSDYCDGIADSDVIYTKMKTYSYCKPLFDHQIQNSIIHMDHLLAHAGSLNLIESYFSIFPNFNKYTNCYICRKLLNKNIKNQYCKKCDKNESLKELVVSANFRCNNAFYDKIEWKNMVYRENKNMKNDINYNLKILKEDSLNKIENNILFSCTTYLTNHTKYEILKKTLDTFIKYNKDDLHLINEFVIMMEYTENNKRYLDKLKQRYPNFIFIQKNKNQKGQAKSLNMIIDKLKDYKLWLHWEDSWYSIGPILKKAYDTLNSSEINYLQLIKKDNIYNIPEINNQHLECKIINDYKIIKPNEMLKKMWRYWEINDFDWSIWKESGWWPFFSLTPLLTDTNIILTTGYFNEDLNKWPFQFEFEWSLRWIRKNKIKLGVLKNINVIRDEDREPTYKQKNYENWEKKLECREKKENYNRNVKYYTLKSDKLKIIFFWNLYCGDTIIKEFIYFVEEGYKYNGNDINIEIGHLNYNKYFVEINDYTLKKFENYIKILVYCEPNKRILNYYNFNTKKYDLEWQTKYINEKWIDKIINVKDINNYLSQYHKREETRDNLK